MKFFGNRRWKPVFEKDPQLQGTERLGAAEAMWLGVRNSN
jgi:hypothetical protein